MHGKVQGTGAASDNGARGRCMGAREGAGRGSGQSAITVHRDGAWVQGKAQGTGVTVHGDGVRVQGTGAERDNGARGRCTGAREGAGRGPGQSAITVHGDGARVHGKVQGNGAASDNGARGRCRGVRGGAGRGPGQSAI